MAGLPLLPGSEGEDTGRSTRLLGVLLWSLMAAVTLFGIGAAVLGAGPTWRAAVLVALLDLVGVGLTILNRRGRTSLAATLFVALAWAVTTSHAALGGGLRAPTPALYLVIILAAGLLLTYRAAVVTAVLLSLSALGIVAGEVLDLLPRPSENESRFTLWLTAVTTVGGICAVQFIAVKAVRTAQRRLREREALLTHVLENLPVGVWFVDRTGRLVHRNQAAQRIWGGGRLVGPAGLHEYRGWWVGSGEAIKPQEWASARAVTDGETSIDEEIEIECFDGTRKVILNSAVPLLDERGGVAGAIVVNQDISKRKRAEQALRRSEEQTRGILDSVSDGFFTLDREWRYTYVNAAAAKFVGARVEDLLGRRIWDCFPEAADSPFYHLYHHAVETGEVTPFEEFYPPLDSWTGGTIYPYEQGITVIFQDITARKRADETARRHAATLTALHEAARALAGTLDSTRLAEVVTRACVHDFGAGVAWVGLARPDGVVLPLAQFPPAPAARIPGQVRWDGSPADDGPTGRAIRTGAAAVVCDIANDTAEGLWRGWALEEGFHCAASFPLITRGAPFGSLTVYGQEEGYATPERIEVFQTYAHEVAAALANARLFEETERRLRNLQALRKIDRAITASLDKRVTFDILLDQVRAELRVDAADLLLLDQRTPVLTLAAASGFRSQEIRTTAVRLGEDDAGIAALERRTVIGSAASEGAHSRWTSLAAAEGFAWRAATSLVSKGQVKGVLEVFHRTPFEPDDDWLAFLEILGGQAALALDSASLFEDLERSNIELKLAYDATIEGWSHALDLRDRETEGHTQRVTELTVRLARAMGMKEEDLAHLRRGALLHDIGKMGVPDAILHKSGPLTDEEWEVMRKHPTYALELLYPIRYLRPALDIPYAHHEKWDGTGYPRGRKGEQIPMAARIFTVVDVWDALRSDRPYRSAWPADRVREHLRARAGTDFDPRTVERFLALDLDNVEFSPAATS